MPPFSASAAAARCETENAATHVDRGVQEEQRREWHYTVRNTAKPRAVHAHPRTALAKLYRRNIRYTRAAKKLRNEMNFGRESSCQTRAILRRKIDA